MNSRKRMNDQFKVMKPNKQRKFKSRIRRYNMQKQIVLHFQEIENNRCCYYSSVKECAENVFSENTFLCFDVLFKECGYIAYYWSVDYVTESCLIGSVFIKKSLSGYFKVHDSDYNQEHCISWSFLLGSTKIINEDLKKTFTKIVPYLLEHDKVIDCTKHYKKCTLPKEFVCSDDVFVCCQCRSKMKLKINLMNILL